MEQQHIARSLIWGCRAQLMRPKSLGGVVRSILVQMFLFQTRKATENFGPAQLRIKTYPGSESPGKPSNISPSSVLTKASCEGISALSSGLGDGGTSQKPSAHKKERNKKAYKKERNKRLWFISLLFSNPNHYRTGTMFMTDSFREHFLPAHITVLQTEAKAVWGGG